MFQYFKICYVHSLVFQTNCVTILIFLFCVRDNFINQLYDQSSCTCNVSTVDIYSGNAWLLRQSSLIYWCSTVKYLLCFDSLKILSQKNSMKTYIICFMYTSKFQVFSSIQFLGVVYLVSLLKFMEHQSLVFSSYYSGSCVCQLCSWGFDLTQ